MVNKIPDYFEKIRDKAVNDWINIENNSVTSGAVHLLFEQIQSPRHVLSELLQNAEDANATEASVKIENDTFLFEHNGEDFTKEHFSSLCNFGHSNKNVLHTIGFRGLGFKSTFSLGDQVEVQTPTLSVGFHKDRFTEPFWIENKDPTGGGTIVRIKIADENKKVQINKNFDEWKLSPLSLAFFRKLRSLKINGEEVGWKIHGHGPIANSEWISPSANNDRKYLLIRSNPLTFPEQAQEEIRKNRRLIREQKVEFPPCEIEIVLGMSGKLYVVLPTGIETDLPFACNAPFIQDPARFEIKDLDSFTNRWLLEQVGKLAATSMIKWLEHKKLKTGDRAKAYALFPNVDQPNNSLSGQCSSRIKESFYSEISSKKYLLTEEGNLVTEMKCTAFPKIILDTWPKKEIPKLFEKTDTFVLSSNVDSKTKSKFIEWEVIEEFSKNDFFKILETKQLPKPKWQHLLTLWAYVERESHQFTPWLSVKKINIIPVKSSDLLNNAYNVVRLGEKKLLNSNEDWDFLSQYLLVLDVNWLRYITKARTSANNNTNNLVNDTASKAHLILTKMELDQASDVNEVIDQVASDFFNQKEVLIDDCVRFTHIAAKLKAAVTYNFRYVNKETVAISKDDGIVADYDGKLAGLIPADFSNILHDDYYTVSGTCSKDEWRDWILSDRSGLLTFPPLNRTYLNFIGRQIIEEEAKKRNQKCELVDYYPNSDKYLVEDWDFEDIFWNHWKELALDNDNVWYDIIRGVLSQKDKQWKKAACAVIKHIAVNGHQHPISNEDLKPTWILKFDELNCLKDDRGFLCKPSELYRRTTETTSLIDLERFVEAEIDNEANKIFFDVLGVKNRPDGAESLLERLKSLSLSNNPPIEEVEKLYIRLNEMIKNCPNDIYLQIKECFRENKIILSRDTTWCKSSAIFIHTNESEFPESEVLRSTVSNLLLWQKIGVPEQPTFGDAISWIKNIEARKSLPAAERHRVEKLSLLYPTIVWEECKYWINLQGEWTSVQSITYKISQQIDDSLVNLDPKIKEKTVDLSMLSPEIRNQSPFTKLIELKDQIEEKIKIDESIEGSSIDISWLNAIGTEFSRLYLNDKAKKIKIQNLSKSLADTRAIEYPSIKITPYLEGTPAGPSRQVDIVWLDDQLIMKPMTKHKRAHMISEELNRFFENAEIKAAFDYGFDRSINDVKEYIQENFTIEEFKHNSPEDSKTISSDNKNSNENQQIQSEQIPVNITTNTEYSEKSDTNSTNDPVLIKSNQNLKKLSKAPDTIEPTELNENKQVEENESHESILKQNSDIELDDQKHTEIAKDEIEISSIIEKSDENVLSESKIVQKSIDEQNIAIQDSTTGILIKSVDASKDLTHLDGQTHEQNDNQLKGEILQTGKLSNVNQKIEHSDASSQIETVEDKKKETTTNSGQINKENLAHSETETTKNKVQKNKPLIERFALISGFERESDNKFIHTDGSWIGKRSSSQFPWEYRTESGDSIQFYRTIDHCLERSPLEVPVEVWELLKESKEKYSLILLDINDSPILVTGTQIQRRHQNNEIELHPCTYRIVFKHTN